MVKVLNIIMMLELKIAKSWHEQNIMFVHCLQRLKSNFLMFKFAIHQAKEAIVSTAGWRTYNKGRHHAKYCYLVSNCDKLVQTTMILFLEPYLEMKCGQFASGSPQNKTAARLVIQ